jgi:hypothetical protein
MVAIKGGTMRTYVALPILCVTFSVLASAQIAKPEKPKGSPPEERWLAPAQRLTSGIDADLFRLPRPAQAVAQAHLASIWWTQEPLVAHKWADSAVEWVTHAPDNESETDRAQRNLAARLVLSRVIPLDPGLRERITNSLAANVPAPGGQSSAQARKTYSSNLVGSAIGDKAHPDQLAKVISDSLQYGVTGTTFAGLFALRDQDAAQADILFQRTLAAIVQGGDFSEGRTILSSMSGPPGQRTMPDAWRPPSYAALARLLSADAATPEQQKNRCSLAGTLSNQRSTLPPDLTQTIDTVWSTCQRPQPTPQQAADNDVFRSRAPKTADDFLAVADELKDPTYRAQMKMNAATRAELDDHDLDRALAILDGMPPEELNSRGAAYPMLRMELAIRAMLKAFEEGRIDRAQRIVETSPDTTRSYIATQFLAQEKKAVPRAFYTLAVHETTTHPPDDPNIYIRLMNALFKIDDLDAVGEIVKAADHWQQKDPKQLKPTDTFYTSPWDWLTPLPLPELGNSDPAAVATKLALAQNPLLRTDLQLSAIRVWVSRYQSESEKMKSAAAAE